MDGQDPNLPENHYYALGPYRNGRQVLQVRKRRPLTPEESEEREKARAALEVIYDNPWVDIGYDGITLQSGEWVSQLAWEVPLETDEDF